MPYNFVVSVHILYNYFVVVMQTFIVTRSNETNASLWSFGGVGGGEGVTYSVPSRSELGRFH